MTKKIGFWPSLALVTGNMIGAGVFLLPATMAAYQGIGITRSLTYARKRNTSFSFPAR